MPMLGSTTKQPRETELYSVAYSKDLDPGDTFTIQEISIVDLSEETTGLPVVESSLVDAGNQKVKMFISGGTAGSIYKVTVRIQTDSGRVLEDDFKLKIKDY